jgi:type I restriction enzyme S subunit
MIAALKPYDDYKETGLPWAPVVPKHWKTRRSKVLFRERVQKGFPDEPLLAATQSKGVVRKEDYGERTVTVTKDFHLLKLVEKGDFVISLRSFEGGIEISHTRGIISPAYTVLAARDEAKTSFFKHFFKSRDFIQSLTLFVTGIREGQNIDNERLSRAELPLPTDQEQDLIGRFLDHAHGRIDRAIRAKRKVIALLNEQKQAIIHKAVTRGLNPDAPLKPSGIPWLGDIPAHWEVARTCRLYRQVTRYIATGSEPKMSMSRRLGLVRSDQLHTNRAAQAATSIRFSVCIPGDLVLNKYQSHNGLFGAAVERGLITSNYSVFEPLRVRDLQSGISDALSGCG